MPKMRSKTQDQRGGCQEKKHKKGESVQRPGNSLSMSILPGKSTISFKKKPQFITETISGS